MAKLIKGDLIVNDFVFLRSICRDFMDSETEDRREVASALKSAYEKMNKKMQGLSAIQIGYKRNAALLRYVKGEEPIIVFNMRVHLKLGIKASNEGCLSEGDGRFLVFRPALALVSYYTEDYKRVFKWLPYEKARIFCHEYDHTQGILLHDIGRRL